LPVLKGRFGEGAPTEIADVVDDYIDAAKTIDNRADELFGPGGIGNIGFYGNAIGAAGLKLQKRLLRGGFVRAIRNGYTRAIFRQPNGNATTDAPTATCN
jgi:hypothetical protein